MRRCARATSCAAGRARRASTSSSSTRCCTISTIRPRRSARRRGMLRPAGRLIIVDFAPHTLEFLRERACACAARLFRPADRRLVCRGRPRAGGRRIRAARRARPALTVKLWLGARPPPADRRSPHDIETDRGNRPDDPAPLLRAGRTSASAPASPSSSSRRRPTRWRQRCGRRSRGWSRSSRSFVSVTYGAGGSTRERTAPHRRPHRCARPS